MNAVTSDAEIRAIIEARAHAAGSGDIDAMMADVADDVMVFDVVEPLCREGKASSRKRAIAWQESYDHPPTWKNHDVAVTADGNVAFSHALSHVTGTLKAGDEIDMWFRSTLGFRRIGGRWLIFHDHGSVPFDPESGKASLGLKPQPMSASAPMGLT